MPKQVEAPIYWRNGRAFLDARAYAEVGGGQERLVPPGVKLATKDPIVARRPKELEELRRRKTLHGAIRVTTLGPFAQLTWRRRPGRNLRPTSGSNRWSST